VKINASTEFSCVLPQLRIVLNYVDQVMVRGSIHVSTFLEDCSDTEEARQWHAWMLYN
jgi:hypothetical protein